MKNIYSLILLFSIIFLSACSKDSFKSYDKRIVGTWTIADVDRHGSGSDPSVLPFREGQFTFNSDGSLVYVKAGVTYTGSWDVRKVSRGDDDCHVLEITAIDFTNQVVLGEYYNDIWFTSTDRFKTTVDDGRHSYTTHFRR
jgi:hypothetical protein